MYFLRIITTCIKVVWKGINILREIVLNLFFLLFVLVSLSLVGLFSGSGNYDPTPENAILVLDLQGALVDSPLYEQSIYDIRRKLSGDEIDITRENSVFELAFKIDQATQDRRIVGIVLKLDNLVKADLPALQYLAKYLDKFKQSGKQIYAVGAHYDQKQYYLASVANNIYLANQGSVSLYGFAATNLYFKELLDNLKINTHVFRVGTYKSAIEPFTRNEMSIEAKENTSRWLQQMWNNYLTAISTQRDVAAAQLVPDSQTMLDRLKMSSGSLTQYALDNNIVDTVQSLNAIDRHINTLFHQVPKVSIYDYPLNPKRMQSMSDFKQQSENPRSLIAVVFVEGTIAGGSRSENSAGSHTIVKQLREIAKNDYVKAVVIRINSPGGSVYDSELIRNEIQALRNKGITVVVSMGAMAASGGYWIASESDYIIANASTLTGSIGIFGVLPTLENSLAHIGVYTDGVSTSPLADVGLTKDLPPQYEQLMQMNIDNGYRTFVSLVADARHMTYPQVDKIAQGQVWLGEEAKKIGLVDQIGDFDDAVSMAASIANLKNYSLAWNKPSTSFFDSLLNSSASVMLPNTVTNILYQQLPISKQLQQNIRLWNNLNDPQNRYTYCLNCADIN